ncbi:MAG: NAD-dependent epimerase/dehydratase family protein [Bacteroidales bacterium]|nr:NAD-dependent epimerase/dehydratase family protein [Bacteroidales bacterium]
MTTLLPTIVLTGASGFIGRYFLAQMSDQYSIIAIARRSEGEANVPQNKNIHWIQWDIGNENQLDTVLQKIIRLGGADFLIHLAAFYDFNYTDDVAYTRTNIEGTRNVIELARQLKIKRFIFASSLAACRFPLPGMSINEQTTVDAEYAYARTKRTGEEMVRAFSQDVACTVIRFAAVFSDWCEYPPLYKFLETWLSRKYDSRILGGKGESAIPYIHIQDLLHLFQVILQKSHLLPPFDIYAASPDGSTCHRELFELATHHYFGKVIKPIHIPRLIAYPGIILRDFLGHLHVTPPPFEKLWMLNYVDLKLDTDASYTRKTLEWEPSARYHIRRRLLFLLAKMKSNPYEWKARNEEALKHISIRTNLLIYEYMMSGKEKVLQKLAAEISSPVRSDSLQGYQQIPVYELALLLSMLYNVLASSVLNMDRGLVINHMDDVASARFEEGFSAEEIILLLNMMKEAIALHLQESSGVRITRQEIHDHIGITIQMAQDELEERFETLSRKQPGEPDARKITFTIDGIQYRADPETSILEAARQHGLHIPTLCYHKDLRIAGNCRICLVELEGQRDLVASCATPVQEGMVIHSNSMKVRTARKHMIELLLSEHHADCTNCYKNGKCELQNLASEFKLINPVFDPLITSPHRHLDDLSPSIVKDDGKCIRCQRCVRSCAGIQGVSAIWASHKGSRMKISTFQGRPLAQVFCTGCGQCIDRCPTGALVEKNCIEEVWSAIWDTQKHVLVQTAPAVRVAIGEDLGIEPGHRVTGKLVSALRRLGFDSVLDTAFSADVTTLEEGSELLERFRNKYKFEIPGIRIPMMTSCSPAWIKYVEHGFPHLLDHLSTCKSPQQIFGVLAKTYYAEKKQINPSRIVTVSVMPCTAKKFEAERPEMHGSGFRDVDYVLTTRELAIMINQAGIDFRSLPNDHYDSLMGYASGAGVIYGATGGVAESVIRTIYPKLTGRDVPFDNLIVRPLRGMDGVRSFSLRIDDPLPQWDFMAGREIRVAIVHGLIHAKKLLQEIDQGESPYHFIEVMACPGGCLGGGGQPIPTDAGIRLKRIQAIYAEEIGMEIRKAHENPEVLQVYHSYLEYPMSPHALDLLHTSYTERNAY